MSGRPIVVAAVAAAAAAAAAAVALRRDEGGTAESPPTQAVVVEDSAAPRPPEFPAVSGDADLVVQWVRILQTGADDDVAWAVSRLRLAGPAARRAVRDAALVVLDSNAAFVEQALEFLSVNPEDADVPLAVAALSSRDPQTVIRAARLLGARPGPDRAATARAIAAAGLAGSRNVRLEALAALAVMGGDTAADEALRLIGASPAADAAAGYGALATMGSDRFRKALKAAFPTETDIAVRFAVADALVTGGDPTPVAWLESLVANPPPGRLDYADAALGALAKVKSPLALERIGRTLADPLAGAPARVLAIRRLESYSLESRRAWLEAAAASARGADDEVRIQALESLARADAPGAMDSLAALVVRGDDASAGVAALVYGRLRRPEAAVALIEAVRRTDLSIDTRALCLRALVLSGDERSCEAIARIVAADRGGEDAPVSLAHNAGAMLGEARPAFSAALGREFLRALGGAFGDLAGAGLVETIRGAGVCCGPEASTALAGFLGHADAGVRANAALALGYAAGPGTERDLKAAWWRAGDADSRAAIAKAMERAHLRVRSSDR